MPNYVEALKKALDGAQIELQDAVKASIEASARAEKARTEHSRLEAAVAALEGRAEPAAPAKRADTELSAEEFDAERKRRQRKKDKKAQENNPLAHLRCAGCGSTGSMIENILQAPSGAPVRMLMCTSCNNQQLC